MDEMLRKVIERRDALRRELETIDSFIHAYGQAMARQETSKPTRPDLFETRRITRAEQQAAVAAMMDEAEREILRVDRPLTRGELVLHLEAKGHRMEGGDKNKVLGTNLWRSKRFHNLKGVGYWPKSTPIPARYAGTPFRETSLG